MNTKHKPLKVSLFILVQAFIFASDSPCQTNRPPQDFVAVTPGHIPTEASIAYLKKESLDESIDRLISYDQQYMGYQSDVMFAQIDLEQMLNTRRSSKVLQTIEKLPEKERAAKCQKLFSKALQAHTNAFNTVLKHEDDPSSPQNQQSLQASKEALCAAMFIAADIGRLDVLSGQFAQLDQVRSELEPRLLAHKSTHPEGGGWMMMDYLVPDNRFQVNVLRLAASRAGHISPAIPPSQFNALRGTRADGKVGILEQVDIECGLAKMKTDEISMVAWDALPRTDLVPGILIDTSKSGSRYVVYDWADFIAHNDLQERLVRKLRSIVFQ